MLFFPSTFFCLRMIHTPSSGMTTSATTSDTNKLMAMVQGKSPRKSFFCPDVVMSRGKKMALMQTVASSSGVKY